MLNKDQTAWLGEHLPFIGMLSDVEIGIIVGEAFFERYGPGETVQSGDECRGFTTVYSGRLRAFYLEEGGREITLFRLLPGDNCILTMACALANITFEINLEAERESEVITIPTRVFRDLSNRNIAVKEFALGRVSQTLSDVFWIMEQVVFRGMGERAAEYLIDQAALGGSDVIEITHEAAARDLGTAREVVSRMLKYFENQGLISQKRGRVKIEDRKGLKKLLDRDGRK